MAWAPAAAAGSPDAVLAAADRAQQALDRPGLAPKLLWFDNYDATRLAGSATLRAGQLEAARTAPTDASRLARSRPPAGPLTRRRPG